MRDGGFGSAENNLQRRGWQSKPGSAAPAIVPMPGAKGRQRGRETAAVPGTPLCLSASNAAALAARRPRALDYTSACPKLCRNHTRRFLGLAPGAQESRGPELLPFGQEAVRCGKEGSRETAPAGRCLPCPAGRRSRFSPAPGRSSSGAFRGPDPGHHEVREALLAHFRGLPLAGEHHLLATAFH